MSHILRHNKTTYCCCGTKHDKDGNQLIGTESKFHCNWQENGTKTNKFHKSSNGRWFDLSKSFLISKVAPIAMSPIGVATFPMLEITFLGIAGIGIFNADQTSPATIPIRIGFVTIPLIVFSQQYGQAHFVQV